MNSKFLLWRTSNYGFLLSIWLGILVHQPSSSTKLPIDPQESKSSIIKKALLSSSPRHVNKNHEKHQDAAASRTFGSLEAVIDTTGVSVWLQGKQIYSAHNHTAVWSEKVVRFHAGVHVIVLHERWLRVMQTGHFMTWQPASYRMLAAMLEEVQDGRIILILGVPEYTSWLMEEALEAIVDLDSHFGPKGTRGESWIMATRKGHRAIFEMMITVRNYNSTDVPPLRCSAMIPTFKERHCHWYKQPEMWERARFCEIYEGYGEFCNCKNPTLINPKNAPRLVDQFEVIPVALVTAKRLPRVRKQITHIWSNQGGDVTPITIMVDGYNPEAQSLAQILNVSVLFHDNVGKVGTNERVNQHIKFALESIFKQHPKVDKAIILEDDLILSPDIMSYFHQTALLMKYDPTIMCVNAYNYNAFPHTANDVTRLYRVQSYPYYGWMTRRADAERLLKNWVPLDNVADWDLWVRRHHGGIMHQAIIPEVPRTKHIGGGGIHVTGYEQEITYQQRPLNTIANVTINMMRLWNFAYSLDLMRALDNATIVKITQHPCQKSPVPKYQNQTHVIYASLSGEQDDKSTFLTLAKCLGFYHHLYENYQGTFSLKFFETPLIIVSCPSSAYCINVPQDVIYKPPSKSDIQYASNHPHRLTDAIGETSWRVPPIDPIIEFNLDNSASVFYLINE